METKYTRTATTKNGRRTWRITTELVSGPPPRQKGGAKAAKTRSPAKRSATPPATAKPAAERVAKAPRKASGPRRRARRSNPNQSQFGF